MILYFENSRNERRKIGEPNTMTEAYKIINSFLDDHNYKSYYSRHWLNEKEPRERIIDVGSYSEFFVLYNEKGWNKKESG